MAVQDTFARRWRTAVAAVPDRPFLVFEASDGRVSELSYANADRLVAGVATTLATRGVRPAATVHVIHTNSVAFVAVWLACARLGASLVPSDPRASTSELVEHARRTTPVLAVCLPARADEYRRAVDAAGLVVEVVAVDPDDVTVGPLVGGGTTDTTEADVTPLTRLAIMFTSGTTSAPKGVELTHGVYAFTGDVMAAAAGLTHRDRQFVVLPLFHANAQYYSIAAAISVGASVAVMHTFSASRFVDQARRHAVTHASLFAAPIRMILARTADDAEPLALRNAWFAQNLAAAQYRAIARLLGCEPRQIYGMTETGPAVLVNPPIGGDPASIGRPTLGCDVRVVNAANEPVRAGETGSIQVGGVPGLTIFQGYLDDPTTTEAAVVERRPDGFVWFDTGDRATVDEAGLHYFGGRGSDVLKVAGENVSVVAVEHVLAEHPAVGDVAVVGVEDEVYDEVPVAFVVLRPGDALDPADTEDELRRWADDHLAPAKRPRDYHFVAELPRTSVGKIRKFLLEPPQRAGAAADRSRRALTESRTPPPKGNTT
jgi:crotonobetaine/carnitine-CoA ligase